MAFDKFKGVATSREVAMAARDAILGVVPDAQVVLIPCADGGEGTMEALSPAHSQRVSVEVCGPLPDMRVNAAYTISHGTAVIEMAAASGLALLADSQRDVMHATTRGTGMLIRHAIAHGAQRVTLGIGGSATNDCGMGILSALGFRFLDQQGLDLAPCGANLAKVVRVDADAVPQQVFNTRFDVITDVDNPLCGTHGAAAVYAPQKGASAQQVTLLDEGARHFSQFMPDGVTEAPGAGAAGGVGAGLKAFLNAILHPGADAVLRFLKVDEAIADADLVMTGEGKIDASTAHGKLPYAVARLCRKRAVPAVALCGILEGEAPGVFTSVLCINPLPVDMPLALNSEVCLSRVASTTEKLIKTIFK